MLVTWSPDLALGYRIVDDGHRLVVDAINRLDKAASRAENDAEVADLLPLLRTHLTEQFQHEEALMRLINAPRIAEHAHDHARILDILAVIDDGFRYGSDVAGVLMLNLICFLVSHLRGTDAASFTPMPVAQAA